MSSSLATMTLLQRKAYAIIPHITGSLSVLGSSLILCAILSDWRNKLSKSFNRIMLGLSCADILQSTAYAFSTSALPRGTPYVYGAAGNTTTCAVQGFFVQCGFAVVIYSASLVLYFLLTIRYNMREADMRKMAEPMMHCVALIWPLTNAVVAASLGALNPVGFHCWIGVWPVDCDKLEGVECTRGERARLFKWIVAGFLPALFFFVPACMALVCWTVWRKERGSSGKFELLCGSILALTARVLRNLTRSNETDAHTVMSTDASSDHVFVRASPRYLNSRKKTREVCNQALRYVGAFLITYIWPFFIRYRSIRNVVHIFLAIFYPLQGFLNFLIYIRPRFIQVRRANPELSVVKVLLVSLIRRKNASTGVRSPRNQSSQSERNERGRISAEGRNVVDETASTILDVNNVGPVAAVEQDNFDNRNMDTVKDGSYPPDSEDPDFQNKDQMQLKFESGISSDESASVHKQRSGEIAKDRNHESRKNRKHP